VVAEIADPLTFVDRRIVTGATLPEEFDCPACGESYNDGPPLITVRRWDGEAVTICTDRCAEAIGFVDAVIGRRRAEARGDGICIVYMEP
jgi:hypothetical protein